MVIEPTKLSAEPFARAARSASPLAASAGGLVTAGPVLEAFTPPAPPLTPPRATFEVAPNLGIRIHLEQPTKSVTLNESQTRSYRRSSLFARCISGWRTEPFPNLIDASSQTSMRIE